MRRTLVLLAFLAAGPAWPDALPLPRIACDSGGGATTGTCDAKPEDASTSPWSMTRPTHLLAGDMPFASCTVDTNATTTFTGGSTWNQFGTDNGDIAGLRLTAWWKIAGDSEPSAWTLSGTGGTNSFAACAISAWRSIMQPAQGTAYEGNVVETTGTGTTATCGSITTSANALAICYCGALNDPTYTPPSGYTEEIDENGTMHAGRVYPSGGATGDVTATLSTSEEWVCRHMSFAYNTAGQRYYASSTATPSASPAYGGGGSTWEDTDQAVRRVLERTKGTTAMTTVSITEETGDVTSGDDFLVAQLVAPVGAWEASGVVQCNFRAMETNSADNMRAQVAIRRTDSSGTHQSVLLAHTTSALSSEFATSLTARNFPKLNDAHTLTSQSFNNGDLLVVELGMRTTNTGGTQRISHAIRLGDNAGTELDRDDATTSDDYGWCDFLGGVQPPTSTCAAHVSLLGVGCK